MAPKSPDVALALEELGVARECFHHLGLFAVELARERGELVELPVAFTVGVHRDHHYQMCGDRCQ